MLWVYNNGTGTFVMLRKDETEQSAVMFIDLLVIHVNKAATVLINKNSDNYCQTLSAERLDVFIGNVKIPCKDNLLVCVVVITPWWLMIERLKGWDNNQSHYGIKTEDNYSKVSCL